MLLGGRNQNRPGGWPDASIDQPIRKCGLYVEYYVENACLNVENTCLNVVKWYNKIKKALQCRI